MENGDLAPEAYLETKKVQNVTKCCPKIKLPQNF